MLNNFNIYDLYKSLFKALKKVYLGDLYLIIEKISFDLDWETENEIFGLEPISYTVSGRYGREINDPDNPLNETFSISFQIDFTSEMIEALFYDYLLK